jgi:nucleotide-binding universal stress UspA family protein
MNWLARKTIVVPIDFSEESFRALDEALQMVDAAGQVHVINVLQDVTVGVPEFALGVLEREAQVREMRQLLADRLKAENRPAVKIQVCYGDPGIEITRFAESVKADLIVMPSHGRTGLKRLLIGSVAERVVRLAHCPVMVLKGEHFGSSA